MQRWWGSQIQQLMQQDAVSHGIMYIPTAYHHWCMNRDFIAEDLGPLVK
jgi:hypothetical protein